MLESHYQNTESSKENQGKKRAQLKHVLLDVDFFNNPKIIALDDTQGGMAVLALVAIYCAMSRATNAVISQAAFRGIAKRQHVTDVDNFEAYCLQEKLIITELNGYSNQPVIDDQESYGAVLERDRERKRKKYGIHTERRGKPDIDIDSDIDIDRSKKKIVKPVKKQFKEFVFLSEAEVTKFRAELGDDVLKRCIIKLDSWIASDPTIKKRKNGKNAAACFRSWVINAVAEEQQRASKLNGNGAKTTNYERNKEQILKSLMEAEQNEQARIS